MLLGCCLPTVAAAMQAAAAAGAPCIELAAHMLHRLPRTLRHPSLKAVVEQRLQGPPVVEAVQAAVAVVQALPLPRPPGMEAGLFVQLHINAALLLYACTLPMAEKLRAEQGGGSTPAAGLPAGSSDHRQQAAWQLVALVPRLASAIQVLADDPDAATAYPDDPDAWSRKLSAVCEGLAGAVRLLRCLAEQPASPAQLASWAAAAAAGLRLQPLLLQLDASFQQRGLGTGGNGTAFNGAQQVSAVLLSHLFQGMPSLQEQGDAAAADSATAQRSLALRLWELHSTAARLCHFLARRGSPLLAGSALLSPTELWASLLQTLEQIFTEALQALLAWERVCTNPAAGIAQG